MRTFRLTVAYDGSAFHGWQIQPGRRTVQGVIEEALAQVLEERDIRISGAGRTDTGVHARGQVMSFRAATPLPARAIAPRLNRALPPDVRVRDGEQAQDDFHARHSARGRRYAYRLLRSADLLLGRTAWWPKRTLDPPALERATRVMEGEHDFTSFESSGSPSARPVCRVTRARWRPWEGGVMLDIVGDHFLYHMVRGVVGTALVVAGAADPATAMRRVIEARDRQRAGPNAPPHGLTLEQVFYPTEVAG